MGALRIFVVCAVVFVVSCENTKNAQLKWNPGINIQCKRETEIDIKSREFKDNILSHVNPSKILIPANKRLNSINAYSHNHLPLKNMGPIIKPIVLNTKNKDDQSHVVCRNNYSRSNNDTGLNGINLIELPWLIRSKTASKRMEDNHEENYIDVKGEQEHSDANETNKNESIEQNDANKKQMILSNVELTKNNNEDNQCINNDIDNELSQLSMLKSNRIEPHSTETLPTDLLPKFKLVSSIPVQSEIPDINPTIADTESFNNSLASDTEIKMKLSNAISRDMKFKEKDKSVPNKVPITVLANSGKVPIKIVPQINPIKELLSVKPTIKTINESAAVTPQINIQNQSKMNDEKLGPDISNEILKTEPEEIIIQNYKYEELLETSTSSYAPPKLISSDLSLASNSNNLNTQHYYENNDVPQTLYGSQPYSYTVKEPYSYSIEKCPNQYVVTTYDNSENKIPNDNLLQFTMYDQDNINENYLKNVSPLRQWYKNYCQPENKDFHQNFCAKNYCKIQQHPGRIWRSWINNQILIRPKSGCGNTDLYKGLGRYLANANAQITPVHPCNRISSGVYKNQNTSPYSNQLQYYGY